MKPKSESICFKTGRLVIASAKACNSLNAKKATMKIMMKENAIKSHHCKVEEIAESASKVISLVEIGATMFSARVASGVSSSTEANGLAKISATISETILLRSESTEWVNPRFAPRKANNKTMPITNKSRIIIKLLFYIQFIESNIPLIYKLRITNINCQKKASFVIEKGTYKIKYFC